MVKSMEHSGQNARTRFSGSGGGRHHEKMRQLMQRMQVQLREESIEMLVETVIAEWFLIKNERRWDQVLSSRVCERFTAVSQVRTSE